MINHDISPSIWERQWIWNKFRDHQWASWWWWNVAAGPSQNVWQIMGRNDRGAHDWCTTNLAVIIDDIIILLYEFVAKIRSDQRTKLLRKYHDEASDLREFYKKRLDNRGPSPDEILQMETIMSYVCLVFFTLHILYIINYYPLQGILYLQNRWSSIGTPQTLCF